MAKIKLPIAKNDVYCLDTALCSSIIIEEMHFHNIMINLEQRFKSGYMFKCKTSNDPEGTKVLFSSCSLVKNVSKHKSL